MGKPARRDRYRSGDSRHRPDGLYPPCRESRRPAAQRRDRQDRERQGPGQGADEEIARSSPPPDRPRLELSSALLAEPQCTTLSRKSNASRRGPTLRCPRSSARSAAPPGPTPTGAERRWTASSKDRRSTARETCGAWTFPSGAYSGSTRKGNGSLSFST